MCASSYWMTCCWRPTGGNARRRRRTRCRRPGAGEWQVAHQAWLAPGLRPAKPVSRAAAVDLSCGPEHPAAARDEAPPLIVAMRSIMVTSTVAEAHAGQRRSAYRQQCIESIGTFARSIILIAGEQDETIHTGFSRSLATLVGIGATHAPGRSTRRPVQPRVASKVSPSIVIWIVAANQPAVAAVRSRATGRAVHRRRPAFRDRRRPVDTVLRRQSALFVRGVRPGR